MADRNNIEIPAFVSFTKTWHNKPYAAVSPARPELSASGKNVIVSGGGTGIGKAIAIAFAQAGAASVTILGRREDRLKIATAAISAEAKDKKTHVLYEICDMTKGTSVKQAFDRIVEKVGEISVLVSNAGALPEPGPLSTTDPDVFMSGFGSNVLSTFNAVQAFIPRAVDKDATFISINSGIAHIAPMPGMGAYASSKVASGKLVDYIAVENPGLRTFNVQPGVISTEINEGMSMEGQDEGTFPSHCLFS